MMYLYVNSFWLAWPLKLFFVLLLFFALVFVYHRVVCGKTWYSVTVNRILVLWCNCHPQNGGLHQSLKSLLLP